MTKVTTKITTKVATKSSVPGLLGQALINPRLVPQGLPILSFDGIDVQGRVGGEVPGFEDAEADHLAHPVFAGAEAGHIEAFDLFEALLAGSAQGPEGL